MQGSKVKIISDYSGFKDLIGTVERIDKGDFLNHFVSFPSLKDYPFNKPLGFAFSEHELQVVN
jgi:hypothetical protein